MAVRDGKADVCSIDAVCVAQARRYRPDYLDGLVEIARSPMVPSLPYVTTLGGDPTDAARGAGGLADDTRLPKSATALFLAGVSVSTSELMNVSRTSNG